MTASQTRIAALITTVLADSERLQRALASVVAAAGDFSLEAIVVVNEPRLPSPNMPGARVLEPGLNLGYAGGLQLARLATDAELLWVIQDDMTVSRATLSAMVGRMQVEPNLAVVSPVTINSAGRVPSFSRGGWVNPDATHRYLFPEVDTRPEHLDLSLPLNWVALSGSLVRASAWDEVGGPDPRFFPLQSVDLEFCFRMHKCGFEIKIEPSAVIEHQVAGSSAGLMKRFLAENSHARFAAKHAHAEAPPTVDAALPPAILLPVAQSASLGFGDLARFANREIAHLQRAATGEQAATDWELNLEVANRERLRLAAELADVKTSLSWRVTAPLRKFVDLWLTIIGRRR